MARLSTDRSGPLVGRLRAGFQWGMPKSRKRRNRKSQSRRSTDASGRTTRHPLHGMQPWLEAMFAADAAEARGDAAGALAVIDALPVGPDGQLFWRPWRVRHLHQLVELGPVLPRWATSRWMLSQATQVVHPSRRRSTMRAMEAAVAVRGGAHCLPGVDEHDANARVVDQDWVFRQVLLYDEGGLDHFVRRVASPDLIAGACRIGEWATTPMSGYRYLGGTPSTTTWDVLDGEGPLVVPNIGSAVRITPGEHVIGRAVPTDDGWMFESEPLWVPEVVARQTARDPASWVAALTLAAAASPDEIVTTPHYFSLLSDVPVDLWQNAMLACASLDGPRFESASVSLADTTLQLAQEAVHGTSFSGGPGAVGAWACLGAAVLEPSVSRALMRVLMPRDADLLHELATRLAEPAAAACERIAATGRRSA